MNGTSVQLVLVPYRALESASNAGGNSLPYGGKHWGGAMAIPDMEAAKGAPLTDQGFPGGATEPFRQG